MKAFRIALATAATLMLVAGTAFACPGHDAAKTASKADGKACCAKAGAQTASATGCSKSAAMAKGCCAKSANTVAQVGDTADVKTCTFRPGAVAFKGTVVCNHCNLHKTDSCQTVFRTDSGCVFTMAGDNVEKIREDVGGGKKLVRVKGSVSDDGKLTVSTYRVVRELDTASAM